MTNAESSTFGRRFLDEFVRLGGPLSSFKYEEIQCLRAGGRKEMIELLRRTQPLATSYADIQRIRKVESPEELAQQVFREYELAAKQGTALTLLGMACFLLGRS